MKLQLSPKGNRIRKDLITGAEQDLENSQAIELVDSAIFMLISGFSFVQASSVEGHYRLNLDGLYTKKDFLPQLIHTDREFCDRFASLWLNKQTWEKKYGHVKWSNQPWISATDMVKALNRFERDYVKDLPAWLRDDSEVLKNALIVVSARWINANIVSATDLKYVPKARTFVYSEQKGSLLASALMDVTQDDIINTSELIESTYQSGLDRMDSAVLILEKIGGAKRRRQPTEIDL